MLLQISGSENCGLRRSRLIDGGRRWRSLPNVRRTGKPRSQIVAPATSDGSAGPQDTPPAAAGTQRMAVDARRVVVTGTAAFGLAFLVLLPFWSWLGEHQHRVWLWTALAGTVLGLLALPLVRKHSGEGRLD
jgi:Protein of unknown function (DUF2530)